MIASEKNYFFNDKKYYYQDITPIKTKYVRLNALMDTLDTTVSNLDIFGEELQIGH
jgi:hypothetical protein